MANPDLKIRGGGGARPLDKGGWPQKTFIQPFGPQFGLKMRGGGGGVGGRVPPQDPPLRLQVKLFREKNVFSQTHLIGVVRAGYKSKQLCQGMGCRIGYLPFFCTCRWN